ncbi:ATP synthase F0 subunit B [Candidatus Parcubacteria bacterium]|nr:MAG: ATP synthase F0 subunit B [Candidatus Parcubacteria bacterium]
MDLLEVFAKIGFDWKLALANLVNFFIIFYILKRFAFKPIGEIIKARQGQIDQGLADAENAKNAFLSAEKEKEEIITLSRKEAHEIIEKGRKQANELADKAAKEAFAIKNEMLADARKTIEAEKKEMFEEVKENAAELITAGVERIIKEELPSQARIKIPERLIRQKQKV